MSITLMPTIILMIFTTKNPLHGIYFNIMNSVNLIPNLICILYTRYELYSLGSNKNIYISPHNICKRTGRDVKFCHCLIGVGKKISINIDQYEGCRWGMRIHLSMIRFVIKGVIIAIILVVEKGERNYR